MKIHRIKLTIDVLSKMPDNERTFVLIAGHMHNELAILNKLFAWCLSGQTRTTPTESKVNVLQAGSIARILAGKLHEGWQLMRDAYFGSKLSLELEALLHESTHCSLASLKSYFSSANLIHTVRNSYSFHYSVDEIARHWHEAALEPDFDFLIGNTYGNSFYQASELAVTMAVLNGINPKDKSAALKAFLEEIQNVASLFNDFLSGVMLVILERALGNDLSAAAVIEDVYPKRGLNEINIPFFYSPPDGQ
jgi:hypothetical protein